MKIIKKTVSIYIFKSFLKRNETFLSKLNFFSVYMVKLKWLEHLSDYENIFETGVVRANEC